MKISVIIPTLNAGEGIARLIAGLRAQTVPPDQIMAVDSSSEDGTAEAALAAGAEVMRIAREAFNHGGTRDEALRRSTGDIVIFMTQDALPADEHAVERLIAPFDDPRVAAAGGRQIAAKDARPFERLVRAHNYPGESRIWDADGIRTMGIRAFMISDVFAAYRREAYLSAGGFDRPVMTNEDMLMAQKLLRAGYRIAYCGDAAVQHSHNLTLRQQYRRNYLVGRTLERYCARLCGVSETGEGRRLASAVLGQLMKEGRPAEAVCFMADCAARLLGNRMGRFDERRRRLSDDRRDSAGGL